jgi:hypothetical protein
MKFHKLLVMAKILKKCALLIPTHKILRLTFVQMYRFAQRSASIPQSFYCLFLRPHELCLYEVALMLGI